MVSPELSLIIPFFNEEGGCEFVTHHLMEELDHHGIDYELILVNNGSTDQTGTILAHLAGGHPRVQVVTVEQNQGYGWGILSGLARSTGQFVGYVDGDTQVPPREVVQLFEQARHGGVDLCKGMRLVRFDGPSRRVISFIYNWLFRWLFRCPVSDVNAKPKILSRDCYTRLELRSKDWFIDAEIVLKTHALGMRIQEVMVEFLPREQGTSKVRLDAIVEFLKNLLIYRLSTLNGTRLLPQLQDPRKP